MDQAKRDELEDYAGTIRQGTELGLTPVYAVTASVDDFDRYEWTWSLNGERYAAAKLLETVINQRLVASCGRVPQREGPVEFAVWRSESKIGGAR